MYLLVVSYVRPAEEVIPHIETHSSWVKKYFQEGIFLMAAQKKSKLGGAILLKSIEKSLLTKIIAEDSYVTADVAEYQIIDLDCKATAPGLELLASS